MSADSLFELRELLLLRSLRSPGQPPATPPILDIPALSIKRGERVALHGPNGSGKTSLLKLLNGLLLPSSGSISFLGEPTARSKLLRSRSVYLHQHPWLLAGTVAYNLSVAGERGRGERRAQAGRQAALLSRLGLQGFERRRGRLLSGGEAQRVALARALATGADVLLLDEPTASADAASQELIRSVLLEEAAAGATIILATHDQSLARALEARILLVEGGTAREDRESP
jgi:tungstate transport system ATP-binding protein